MFSVRNLRRFGALSAFSTSACIVQSEKWCPACAGADPLIRLPSLCHFPISPSAADPAVPIELLSRSRLFSSFIFPWKGRVGAFRLVVSHTEVFSSCPPRFFTFFAYLLGLMKRPFVGSWRGTVNWCLGRAVICIIAHFNEGFVKSSCFDYKKTPLAFFPIALNSNRGHYKNRCMLFSKYPLFACVFFLHHQIVHEHYNTSSTSKNPNLAKKKNTHNEPARKKGKKTPF